MHHMKLFLCKGTSQSCLWHHDKDREQLAAEWYEDVTSSNNQVICDGIVLRPHGVSKAV